MKALAAGIWTELRERRLWPVAVLLLVAIVAVPLTLRTPERTPAAASPTPAAAPAPARTALLAEAKPAPSRLDAFDAKNPFRPLSKPQPAAPTGPPAADKPSDGASGGSTPVAPSTPTAPAPSSGSVRPPSGGTLPRRGASGETKLYTYTVDVRVGASSADLPLRRGVKRLALLPSSRNPLLVFLGVDVTGREAIFLLDDELSQAGEGTCKPNADSCSLLALRTHADRDEHFFTAADGKEYTLKLEGIDRVEAKAAARSARRAATRERARTSGRAERGSELRRFVAPIFGDEVRGR